jgi:AraC-like DNA-binding protein
MEEPPPVRRGHRFESLPDIALEQPHVYRSLLDSHPVARVNPEHTAVLQAELLAPDDDLPGHPIARDGEPLHRPKAFTEPLRIETLAKHLGLSPSALHLHFKCVTALSPLQYQKRLRLQEVRRLMLGQGLDAGEAAFRVGYESPSQFGRAYRRLFGESPRRDVAALKVETSPASHAGV